MARKSIKWRCSVIRVPDLQEFARIAIAAGAGGITVNPRPDKRAIRRNDVPA